MTDQKPTTHAERTVRLTLVASINANHTDLCGDSCDGASRDGDGTPVCNFFGRYLTGPTPTGKMRRARECLAAEESEKHE